VHSYDDVVVVTTRSTDIGSAPVDTDNDCDVRNTSRGSIIYGNGESNGRRRLLQCCALCEIRLHAAFFATEAISPSTSQSVLMGHAAPPGCWTSITLTGHHNCSEATIHTDEKCLYFNAVVVEVAWPATTPPRQGSTASHDLTAAFLLVHDHCVRRHERQRIRTANYIRLISLLHSAVHATEDYQQYPYDKHSHRRLLCLRDLPICRARGYETPEPGARPHTDSQLRARKGLALSPSPSSPRRLSHSTVHTAQHLHSATTRSCSQIF
jgi:hypothetical protein